MYRAPVDGGAAERIGGGLGALRGNVDSGCIAGNGEALALADGEGNVWRSAAAFGDFERIASDLGWVTGVTVT